MLMHNPVGSCCTRPRFNSVGGVDDRPEAYALPESGLVHSIIKIRRKVIFGASIVVALAVAALLLLAN